MLMAYSVAVKGDVGTIGLPCNLRHVSKAAAVQLSGDHLI